MKSKIEVKGIIINLQKFNNSDYVSLTDIVKGQDYEKLNDKPNLIIRSWLKNLSTLDFLEEWEIVHNPNFLKGVQMDTFKIEALRNKTNLTAKYWIENTNAKGLMSKSGRYGGGIFAHKDIALNFCYWINPKFQVWFIQKFQQLATQAKESENFYLNRVFDDSLQINRFSKQILQNRGEIPKKEEE